MEQRHINPEMADKNSMEPKSFNSGYNIDYNAYGCGWVEEHFRKLDRKTAVITFDPHVFDRKEYYGLDLDNVEETVRTGKIKLEKCKEPKKVCFERYFGKENLTYCVITIFHQEFIEVRTIWPRNGR